MWELLGSFSQTPILLLGTNRKTKAAGQPFRGMQHNGNNN